MKKKFSSELDPKQKKSLPAIKKSKSIFSPKNLIKPQMSPNAISPDVYQLLPMAFKAKN